MATILALVAAFLFALGPVLQQKGTLETAAGANDPHFLAQAVRRPVWLFGALAQIGGWLVQAVALNKGALVMVQSVMTLSIVIALPLGVRITNQRVGRPQVYAALASVAGIVIFLAFGQPAGGTNSPSAAVWWLGALATVTLVGLFGAMGWRRQGASSAALLGCAAGVCFAFQATVTKQFTTLVGHGIGALLSSWTVYALVVSAMIGFVFQQSSLKAGVLASSMAASNVATMLASVILGIVVYGEVLSHGHGHLALSFVGLALTVGGVLVLSRAPGPASPAPVPAQQD